MEGGEVLVLVERDVGKGVLGGCAVSVITAIVVETSVTCVGGDAVKPGCGLGTLGAE